MVDVSSYAGALNTDARLNSAVTDFSRRANLDPVPAAAADSASASAGSDPVAVTGTDTPATIYTARAGAITKAATVLQTADAALAEIDVLLGDLANLAASAEDDSLSAYERSQYDTEFQTLKQRIEDIATHTTVDGEPILQGDGNGGDYSFGIVGNGTGNGLTEITVASAGVSDLSTSLDSGDLLSADNAETASTAVEDAQNAVSERRDALAVESNQLQNDLVANDAAETSATAGAARLQAFSETYDPPALAKDLAKKVASQGGIDLNAGSERTMRQLLLRLADLGAAIRDSAAGTAPGWQPPDPSQPPSPAPSPPPALPDPFSSDPFASDG